ncbi:dynein regulatory complex subunit 2-like [Neodiprion fabricii]|uniref:dynein regulatory complex subunit 2-like n=1 Tax=Neodiprion fabricii TaxID=2872261 RepID=UPI001ED97AC1|nr:dynein regulatory complex subunit 2-like [Neodiprion fabricii]
MPPKSKPKGKQQKQQSAATNDKEEVTGGGGQRTTKKKSKGSKAEKKAAKLRAAEERENLLKTERLRQEIERGNLNAKRFSKPWRDMVMSIKMPQIKEDLEVAWHTFDRAIDVKNYSISLLLDELEKAEEQYQMNERAHLETIGCLMKTYKERLSSEDKNYQAELQKMIDVAFEETEAVALKQNDDEVYIQAVIYAMEQRLEILMKSVMGATISKVGEAEDDNRNTRRVAKFILEKSYHALWEQYVANLVKYQADTENMRRDYNVIKEKDDKARSIIARQISHTASLFESIRKMKDKIHAYKVTAGKSISEIIAERDFFNEAYWIVKTRFMSEQTADREALKIITAEFNATSTHLKRILTKGENLLSLVQICRKYETPEEIVLPFKLSIALDDYPEDFIADFGWERSHAVMEQYRNLELFWRRVGHAKIVSKQLRLERDKLRDEGRCLKQCLKHCIAERSVGNEESGRIAELEITTGKPVVIEASLCKFQ